MMRIPLLFTDWWDWLQGGCKILCVEMNKAPSGVKIKRKIKFEIENNNKLIQGKDQIEGQDD